MTVSTGTVQERYADVRERIAKAAARAGRDPEDIHLIAVTKFAEPEQIRELIDLGHRDFGENKVQTLVQHAAMADEYLARLRVLAKTRGDVKQPEPARWHMIGHLQRNKARKATELCRLIHTVDSLRLAEELQQIALKRDDTVEVLVQVNCSEEPQKYGCPPPAAKPLCEQIETMVNVRVRGLMTMAALGDTPDQARATFARLRDLYEEIELMKISDGKFNLLSMGMTNDFEPAIEEGANLVRIGSAIFGEPPADAAD